MFCKVITLISVTFYDLQYAYVLLGFNKFSQAEDVGSIVHENELLRNVVNTKAQVIQLITHLKPKTVLSGFIHPH